MNYPRYLGWKYGGLDAEDLGQELSILEWLGKRAGEHPTQTRAKLKWKAIDYYRHEKRRRKYWGPYDETVISRLIAPEPLQKLLHTTPLPPIWLAGVFGFGFLSIMSIEFGKWIYRK